MPEDKDILFGRLAVEREYVAHVAQEQVDEAREAQERGAEAMGMRMPMAQILVSKGLLTKDQAQDLANAVAVQTGEASIVAGYEVVSKLGQGGMGAVYKARQVETGQYVALKILPPSLANEAMVKRFQREADVTSKLDHEHIVGCVEFGFDKRRKCHFCALEFVEGEDLGKRLKRTGAMPEGEAAAIARQIARALQHANANGLVHRDVKPENIMITPAGASKLLDLGLARPANMEATRFTQSGMFVGSPYYASPEQALGSRDIDTRADIYSLGATLYHMITGTPPFAGSTVMEVLQKHVHEKVPWPADVKPELSDGVCRVIARMMAKKPEERYQDPTGLI
ncbi:MAG: serine/threonine protein kinase, partial [Planctomycetota bacterium]